MTKHPLLEHLRKQGYEVAQSVSTQVGESDMGPIHSNFLAPITDASAEGVLRGFLDEHAPSDPETDYLEHTVAMLEEALRAIRARIEGEYDHPALLRAGALGDKDADILRIIDPVLP